MGHLMLILRYNGDYNLCIIDVSRLNNLGHESQVLLRLYLPTGNNTIMYYIL